MKYTEDEEQCIETIYNVKDTVDTDQDILLDNLQSAIDTISDRIDELEQQLVSDYNNLTGLVNQSGIEISDAVEQIASDLRDEIATFESNFAQIVSTQKVKSEKVEADYAKITEADIGTANVDKVNATDAEIDTAKINHSVQDLIEATRIVVNTLEAESLNYNALTALVANLSVLRTNSADVKALVSGYVETGLIQPPKGQILQPNTFPQNDELLVINVPAYDGEVKLTELHGLFSISVINNGLVTFGSPDGLVYAVTFDDFGTHIYFDSVGKTISYNELHIGSKTFSTSTSEIIEKSTVAVNVKERFGAISRSPIDINQDSGWKVVVVDELPENPVNNTMYVIDGVGCIYYTNDTAYPLTYVFNLDYEQDEDNPIVMSWNTETSTLSVSVSYEDSSNSDIDLSFVNLGQYLPPEGPMYEDDDNSDINFDFITQ